MSVQSSPAWWSLFNLSYQIPLDLVQEYVMMGQEPVSMHFYFLVLDDSAL